MRAAVGGGAVDEATVPYEFEYGGQVEQGGDAAGIEQEEQPVIPRLRPLSYCRGRAGWGRPRE